MVATPALRGELSFRYNNEETTIATIVEEIENDVRMLNIYTYLADDLSPSQIYSVKKTLLAMLDLYEIPYKER